MTTTQASNGSASSRHLPTPPSTSASSLPEPLDVPLTTYSPLSPPLSQGPDTLYSIGIQAQDIAGEIALAADLLESDDPEDRQAAVELIEHFLDAAEHTQSLLMEKSDKIAYYIEILRAQSAFRKQQSKRLAELAAADERRADKLLSYMTTVLQRINPSKTKYSLPTHELTSRAVNDKVELIPNPYGEYDIPDDLMTTKVTETITPDKAAIKQALKQGRDVPGARLISYRSWSIK